MLQHPLATGSSEYQEKNEEETFSELPPLTDDDLSSFVRRVSSPRPQDDSVVRAASPFGKRYLKPINGIQIKGFARSG
jgi:hypothetical protein